MEYYTVEYYIEERKKELLPFPIHLMDGSGEYYGKVK